MVKYKLFSWYAWGLANNWKLEFESDTMADIKNQLKGRKLSTYAIAEDNKIIKYVCAPLRNYMASPSFPIHYNGEIFVKEN